MPHFRINQRCIPHSKVCGLHRNGVRHAPFWCAPYSVFLCGLRRFMPLGIPQTRSAYSPAGNTPSSPSYTG
jgi:hypothetical protein